MNNSNLVEYQCQCCKQRKRSGYYIHHLYLCLSCEQLLISLEPEDPLYKEYVKLMTAARRRNSQPNTIPVN
ncbi:sigma factor G inhibitor Gin [Mangrovibacillus cuniculi]